MLERVERLQRARRLVNVERISSSGSDLRRLLRRVLHVRLQRRLQRGDERREVVLAIEARQGGLA